MRALKAVLFGFIAASALLLAGGWAFIALTGSAAGQRNPTLPTALLALVGTGATIAVGAYVASRIDDSNETTSGYIVAQAFFGFGMIREFWSGGSSWYGLAAIMLVIPCAIIGRTLARRSGGNKTLGVA